MFSSVAYRSRRILAGVRVGLPGLLAFAVFFGSAMGDVARAADAASPPNIVLIFADDQGYQDIGCFGSPNIQTPNLDRMAAEGRKFTEFYVAAPVCSASRAALMTGSYPLRVGITGVLFPRHSIGLAPDEVTIADVLKSRGYATACIGKWHLGHLPRFLPTNNGFDSYFGIPYSNDMDPVAGKSRNLDAAWRSNDVTPWNVPLMENETVLERPAQQTTLIERYTERAVSFIRENRERPFFLYLPHTMPHIPLFVSPEFYVDDPHRAYQATIEQIDDSVGQVLAALEEAGVDDNTLVVYTSDNGPWLAKKHHGGSALPLRDGKFSTFEGGMRVPCIMRYPGTVPPSTTCSEIAASIDLLPTFARLAGATPPDDRVIDGLDITDLLTDDGAVTPHDAYYFYRGENLEALRDRRWKLRLARGANGKAELYDLDADASETTNVAGEHAAVVAELSAKARQFDEQLRQGLRPVGTLATDYASRALKRTGPKIVFLGDSITANGAYIDYAETWFLLNSRQRLPRFIDLGLSSETVSGLSEPHHPFPRPWVHDRLDRVLEATHPEVVVACYGINCGIYQPFSEERFAKYQEGIKTLIDKVNAIGGRVVLFTPPPFAGKYTKVREPADGTDFGFKTPYKDYDDVMARYAAWLLTLDGNDGVRVADIRKAMLPHIAHSYARDPVHPKPFGHEVMGEAFLRHWGAKTGVTIPSDGTSPHQDDALWQAVQKLVRERRLAYDKALLDHIGHKRPGAKPKYSLAGGIERAQEIDARIAGLLADERQ